MKEITEATLDDILKLKYGEVVKDGGHTSYVTNEKLGKVFGVPGHRIRQLCQKRFAKNRQKELSFLEQLRQAKDQQDR